MLTLGDSMRSLLILLILIGCGNDNSPVPRYRIITTNNIDQFVSNTQLPGDCLSNKLNVVAGEINSTDFLSSVKIRTYDDDSVYYGVCTAGLLNGNQLITAAHCLFDTKQVKIDFGYIQLEVFSWRVFPKYSGMVNDRINIDGTDVGVIDLTPEEVIVFKRYIKYDMYGNPRKDSLFVSKISDKSPIIGNCFAWIGYGRNKLGQQNSTDGLRRIGSNVITGIVNNNNLKVFYNTIERANVLNKYSAIFGKGDSGGPVYNSSGDMIGIVSSSGDDLNYQDSFIIDITNNEVREFLERSK